MSKLFVSSFLEDISPGPALYQNDSRLWEPWLHLDLYCMNVVVRTRVSEDRLTQTSAGVLVVTNQRIVLQPALGNKPVNIPITKVLSYNCYNNGIEVCKEGREKGYFISIFDFL